MQCKVVVPHTEIECPIVPGVGHGHTWKVRVGGQSSPPSSFTTGYSVPVLTNVAGPGSAEANTAGGEEIVLTGKNFGPISSFYMDVGTDVGARYGPIQYTSRYKVSTCKVSTDHTIIRCLSSEGTGKGHAWILTVGGQDSPLLDAKTSYGPPMVITYSGPGSNFANTHGNEYVLVEGRNFGPILVDPLPGYPKQPELVQYTNNLVIDANLGFDAFNATECEVIVPHEFLRCNTSEGAGAALQWTVIIDQQSSVQPTTNYAPPKVTNLYTNLNPSKSIPLSTEGNELIYIQGENFGPIGKQYVGKVTYGPTGRDYVAKNCTVIEHSEWMQCETVPGIGDQLHVVVSVLGQSSPSSEVYLSYGRPEITQLIEAVTELNVEGPTSGELRLRIDGHNFAIRDPFVTKFVRWFDGDRIRSVQILQQPGVDYFLVDTLGFTASAWVKFDQPEGYGTINDVSIRLESINTGIRIDSDVINFTYADPSITRAYPEEPFDCPTNLQSTSFGTWDSVENFTPVNIVLASPKLLSEGAKVQITGWTGSFTDSEGVERTTDFLSDTFATYQVSTGPDGLATSFKIKYTRKVASGLTVASSDLGVAQVRRNGLRIKLEGRNFCRPGAHPASSPQCARILVAAGGSANAVVPPFESNSVREVCSHTHDAIELLSYSTSGHIRIEVWDEIDTSDTGGDVEGKWRPSNTVYFDQKTPQVTSSFRQRLTQQRFKAVSFTKQLNSMAIVNLGPIASKCIAVGVSIEIENSINPSLNGPHVIQSLIQDATDLIFTLPISALNLPAPAVVSAGSQPENSLVVVCPGFQTHGVDVLTITGTYWPKNADFLEVLIGDTIPTFDTIDSSSSAEDNNNGRRLGTKTTGNSTLDAERQAILTQYITDLSLGKTGTKCPLTQQCQNDFSFGIGKACLKLDVNQLDGTETFTLSCVVPAGAGGNHPIVVNRLTSACDVGRDPDKRCSDGYMTWTMNINSKAALTASYGTVVTQISNGGGGGGEGTLMAALTADAATTIITIRSAIGQIFDTTTDLNVGDITIQQTNLVSVTSITASPVTSSLSSLQPLESNALVTYSTPVINGVYASSGGTDCNVAGGLLIFNEDSSAATIPPSALLGVVSELRIQSPTEGMSICVRGRNLGNTVKHVLLEVGRWTSDFPAYKTPESHLMHPGTDNYDQVIFNLPPGDGIGGQNALKIDVDGIIWPRPGDPWFLLDIDYLSPSITKVEPVFGPARGFRVTLTGMNFGPSKNPNLPTISVGGSNSYPCIVQSSEDRSHSSVVCDLSNGVGKDLDVTIVVNGQEYTLQKAISYEPPQVRSVLPTSIRTTGGENVTIIGLNFGNNPAPLRLISNRQTATQKDDDTTQFNHPDVTDISVPVKNILVWEDTKIIFSSPEGYGKEFGVVVSAGMQDSNADVTMGYQPPTISNITLAGNRLACTAMIRNDQCGAPTSGGFLVRITGDNFASFAVLNTASKALFELYLQTTPTPVQMGWCGVGQVSACVVSEKHMHNSMLVYMPAGIGASLQLRLRVANQMDNSVSVNSLFSYDAPWINAITPREGNAGSIGNSNGNRIKIEGINFGEPRGEEVIAEKDSGSLVPGEDSSADESAEKEVIPAAEPTLTLQVYVGGKECLDAVLLKESGQPTHIECRTQRDRVGFKDIILITARQNITYSANEWECNSTTGVCGGEYNGGKQLFMMQCEDSTYGLFGEWCVDCPHVTDVVSAAQAIDAGTDSQEFGQIDGGCGEDTIGADICVKPVLRSGELDYIARCPTGSARQEILPNGLTEAYDTDRILESGVCMTPDAYHLSESVRLACAPFPNTGFFKYYTNSSDKHPNQIATSRCHSLRQPPGGARQACSFVVSCEPRSACFSNNRCALDNEDENLLWDKNTAYDQGDFIMMPNDPSNIYVCRDVEGCWKGLDPAEERTIKMKRESVAITQQGTNISATTATGAKATKWVQAVESGLWKPAQSKYAVGDLVYHQLNVSLGDVSCDDPNDLSCSREVSEYYGYLCIPKDITKWVEGCTNSGATTPGVDPERWIELRPRYSNYKRRINKSPLYVGRCSQCAKGFFRLDGVCAVCPKDPVFLMVVIVLGFFSVAVAFYLLHIKDINVAILSIGVDYFQIVALFSRARIAWPKLLKEIFRLFSFFNFNIDLAAPECLAVFEYDTKWMLFTSVPLVIIAFAFLGVSGKFCKKICYRYILGRRNSRKKLCGHAHSLIGLVFTMMYYLYLSLTKYTLDIFSCSPMSPPEFERGVIVTYLDATFEQCYVPGGMHMRLVGFAILALMIYVIAYPLVTALLLIRYRKEAFLDQLLRAQDLGKSRKDNKQWNIRKIFGKLYYMFKPRKFYWIIVILMRKAMIAFTALMFKKNPAFQLAMALFIMFTAYAVQVLHRPYMSMVERPEVIRLAVSVSKI